MNKHFIRQGIGYLLSPAAVLLMTSEAIRSADTSLAGKERSMRVISQVMEVARRMNFEQAAAAETKLIFGAEPAQLLSICDAITQHIGGWAVVAIARRVTATATEGDA